MEGERERAKKRAKQKTRRRKKVILGAFLHLDIYKRDHYIIFLFKCNKDVSMGI
jgi:hypothetical protein